MDAFAAWLHATPFSQTIQSVHWIIPFLQSVHIVMIGVVFVSSLVIALRVLGKMRADETFGDVWSRFAPWLWAAFFTMLATGLLLIVGEPAREFDSTSFWLKMGLVILAVSLTVALRAMMRAAPHDAASPLEGPARPTAITLVVLWVFIVFLGRAIAYDTEVWGRLSLQS
ncbi:MAG: hypothetical protein EOP08_00555 [Proteobacteria bacterium]|nr:MAG: hypothetical protein EOP08_00555 [Pseudomonadota bacterium]